MRAYSGAIHVMHVSGCVGPAGAIRQFDLVYVKVMHLGTISKAFLKTALKPGEGFRRCGRC